MVLVPASIAKHIQTHPKPWAAAGYLNHACFLCFFGKQEFVNRPEEEVEDVVVTVVSVDDVEVVEDVVVVVVP